MKGFFTVAALLVGFLIVLTCLRDPSTKPPGQVTVQPKYPPPMTVERAREIVREKMRQDAVRRQIAVEQQQINLQYLADVEERREFRRRYRIAYGKECPF